MTKEYMKLEDIIYRDSNPQSEQEEASVSDFVRNPLCCACYYGHLSIVKYFVEECGYDPTKSLGSAERFPLRSAILGNKLKVVKYLARKQDFLLPGYKIVFLATRVSDITMIKYLAETLHYDFSEEHGKSTPLHVACSIGKLDAVKYFLEILKHNASSKGLDGYQPIHAAAHYGQLEIIKYLAHSHFNSITALTEYGETPLHLASCFGHMSVIKYLMLEHKCDPLSKYTENSSFDEAVINGKIEVVKYFVRKLKWDSTLKAKSLSTYLFSAARNGHLPLVTYFIEELGCDLSARDQTKRNVLHHSVLSDNITLCKYLIEVHKCQLIKME